MSSEVLAVVTEPRLHVLLTVMFRRPSRNLNIIKQESKKYQPGVKIISKIINNVFSSRNRRTANGNKLMPLVHKNRVPGRFLHIHIHILY